MNWVDIVIIAIAIIGALAGYKQGLIVSLFSFLGLVVGVAVAGAASDSLAEKLSSSGALWAYVVSFALILIVVMVIFHILAVVVRGMLKMVMLGWVDSFGGAFLGLWVGGLLTAGVVGGWVIWFWGGGVFWWGGACGGGGGGGLLTAAMFIAIGKWAASQPEATSIGNAIGNSVLAGFLIDEFRLLLGLLPPRFDAVVRLFS